MYTSFLASLLSCSALPSPNLFLIAVHLIGICPSCRIVPISQSVSCVKL